MGIQAWSLRVFANFKFRRKLGVFLWKRQVCYRFKDTRLDLYILLTENSNVKDGSTYMLNNCSRITRIIGIIMHYVHINYNKSLTSWSKTQVQYTCIPLWKNIVQFWSLMKWLYGAYEILLFGSLFSFLIRNQNRIRIQILASFWSIKSWKL